MTFRALLLPNEPIATGVDPDDERGGKRPDLRCWGLTCALRPYTPLTTQSRQEPRPAVADGRCRAVVAGEAAPPARDIPALHPAREAVDIGPQHPGDLARPVTDALATQHRLEHLRHRAAAGIGAVDGLGLPAVLARRRQCSALPVRHRRLERADTAASAGGIDSCFGDGISAVRSRRQIGGSTTRAWRSAASTACVWRCVGCADMSGAEASFAGGDRLAGDCSHRRRQRRRPLPHEAPAAALESSFARPVKSLHVPIAPDHPAYNLERVFCTWSARQGVCERAPRLG